MNEVWIEIFDAVNDGRGAATRRSIRELETEDLKRFWDLVDVVNRELRYEYIRREYPHIKGRP